MREYEALVKDLKNLRQRDGSGEYILPMAEDEWNTRPDTVSYGLVSLDFEADSLAGDDAKRDIAYEGSVDLYSLAKSGAGWVTLIKEALTRHCGACWSLNSRAYERETEMRHWEWVFQVGNAEVPDDGDDGEG